jgi:HEAT repeat protein
LIGIGLFVGLMLAPMWLIVDNPDETRTPDTGEVVRLTTSPVSTFDTTGASISTMLKSRQATVVGPAEAPEFSTLKLPALYPELIRITELENLDNDAAIASLEHFLKDTDPAIRLAALESLADMGRYPASLSLIVSMLKDTNAQIRVAALEAIAGSNATTLMTSIEPLVYDYDLDVRISAIETLASMESEYSISSLASLLSDPDSRVRHHAVIALGEVGGELAIMYLQQALYDPEGDIRENAETILVEHATAMVN